MMAIFTLILFIILLSRLIEETIRIPATVSILLLSIVSSIVFPEVCTISPAGFRQILFLMLPIILLPDVLSLSFQEIKKNITALTYLSVIAVVISILIAAAVTPVLLPQYNLSFAMLFALFSILMATDAITVSGILKGFNVPKRLKIYAEGESLFNDVTALILFYFIALPMLGGDHVSVFAINKLLIKVLVFSVGIGVLISYLGFLSVKLLKDEIEQFIIIYLVAILSFLLAEHLHVSGILAIIVSVMGFRVFIDRELKHRDVFRDFQEAEYEEQSYYSSIIRLIKQIPAITKRGLRAYKKEATYVAIFANAVLFFLMAHILDLGLVFSYWKEIVTVFLLTSLVRCGAISSMYFLFKVPMHWNSVLTLSGVKGGLTIIMAHSLPEDFIYREMFVAIVFGIVLLTTFVYSFGTMLFLRLFQDQFKKDKMMQSEAAEGVDLTRELKDFIEKDPLTGAYHPLILEEILTKELARAGRYKMDLALVGIELGNLSDIAQTSGKEEGSRILGEFGRAVMKKIRVNDFFCEAGRNRYTIIATNTSLAGAIHLVDRIKEEMGKNQPRPAPDLQIGFGVTEFSEGDTCDMMLEKIQDSLEKGRALRTEEIGVEV